MLQWAELAIAAYVEGGVDESRLAAWRWHLERLLASLGGAAGDRERTAPPGELRCRKKPYERGTVPLRDERFVTFKNTGDYNVADGQPRFPAESYEIGRAHV